MDLQQALEAQIKRREDLLDKDRLIAVLSTKCPGAGVALFDQDGQKRFAADADFWPWRDDLLDGTEQSIEDLRKDQEIEAMEQQRRLDEKIDMIDRKDLYS